MSRYSPESCVLAMVDSGAEVPGRLVLPLRAEAAMGRFAGRPGDLATLIFFVPLLAFAAAPGLTAEVILGLAVAGFGMTVVRDVTVRMDEGLVVAGREAGFAVV